MRKLNLTGVRFGKLIATQETRKKGRIAYLCRCDCGGEITTLSHLLTSGKSVSCGCKRRVARRTHGKSNTREFRIWADMRRRCIDERNKNYPSYGGRGITVCNEWSSFDAFVRDMGESNGLTLDRVDVNGHYCKANCRWVDRQQQSRNKRNNHILTFNGFSCCISEWAERTGIKVDTLKQRIRRGWTTERTLTEGVTQ